MKTRVMLSKTLYRAKPTSFQYSIIQNNPKNWVEAQLSTEELLYELLSGKTTRAGLYNLNTFKDFTAGQVIGSTLVALDFDEVEETPQQILDIAISYGFIPNFWYYSFSQPIKPNSFRVVWLMKEILKPEEYVYLYSVLETAFGKYNPDSKTRDLSRMWLGTINGGEIVKKDLTTKEEIEIILNQFKDIELQTIKKSTTRKRKKHSPPPKKIRIKEEQMVNLSPQQCRLWGKWKSGEYLNQRERKNLILNLKYIEFTSQKSVIDFMLEYYNPEQYIIHESNFVGQEKKYLYIEYDRNESPYPIVFNMGNWMTLPEFFNSPNVPLINPNKKLNYGDVVEQMRLKIEELLISNLYAGKHYRWGLDYFISQVGSGKTHYIIEWLLRQDLSRLKVIYSIPTHGVGEEFKSRLIASARSKNIDVENFIQKIDGLDYSDYEKRVMELGLIVNREDDEEFDKRKENIQKVQDSGKKGVFIVTHQLLSVLGNIEADLIIIDEDPSNSLIDTWNTTVDQLKLLDKFVETMDEKNMVRDFAATLQDKIDELDGKNNVGFTIKKDIFQKIIRRISKEKIIKDKNFKAPIFKFTRAENIYVDNFGTITGDSTSAAIDNAREKRIPVVVFTATPKIEIVKLYYGDDIIREKIEIGTGNNKGKVYWFSGKSGAKGKKDINGVGQNMRSLFKYAADKIKEQNLRVDYVLTFKDSMELAKEFGFSIPHNHLKDNEPIHLANCQGLDFMKGLNIAVIGKYDIAHQEYVRLWAQFGQSGHPVRQNQNVEINGIETTLYLFTDPRMRQLQLENIDEMTTQAVGRARAFNQEEGNVYVFSNYPVREYDVRLQ